MSLAGRQVHDGVGTPAHRPAQLLDLFLDRGGDRGVADVGVDLHQEVAADDHRLELRVLAVGGDDRAAPGDLAAHELRVDVLADRDELHLLGDHALAGRSASGRSSCRRVATRGRGSSRLRRGGSPSPRVVTLRAGGVVDVAPRSRRWSAVILRSGTSRSPPSQHLLAGWGSESAEGRDGIVLRWSWRFPAPA